MPRETRLFAPPDAGARRARGAQRSASVAAALQRRLRSLVRAMRLVDQETEAKVGLPSAQLAVLVHLWDGPADSLAELALRTCTDPSSVSVVVQRLVEAGFVSRSTTREDRRRVVLSLTPAGRARARPIVSLTARRLDEVVATLGVMSAARFVRLSDAVLGTLGHRDGRPERRAR